MIYLLMKYILHINNKLRIKNFWHNSSNIDYVEEVMD